MLEWLIQELENVSDVMLGRNEEWFKESVEKAITAFHESNASLLKALEDASQNERWLPAYRSACAAKLKWARALFKRFNSPPLPEFESASSPKVRDWSAQAQIFTKAGYVAATGRHIEPKPAGFVDLQVLMGIPECLLVKCFDKEVVYRIDSNNWGMSEEG